jgi:hypothetical protein
MTLDLARILHYGTREGTLADRVQRRHLSLIDGVVAGEGAGPLSPSPVRAGALVLGDDVALTDRIACRLMGFDPARIPLVREAFASGARPLSERGADALAECVADGQPCLENALAPLLARAFVPPSGWRQQLS